MLLQDVRAVTGAQVETRCAGCSESTTYTASGMSAIAALLAAALQCNERIDIEAPKDCYSETRELFRAFYPDLRVATAAEAHSITADPRPARLLWLDSSVRSGYDRALLAIRPGTALVVLDATCFWRGSGKILRAVRGALRSGVPIALVRSHAKLDCFGTEYGRLGSVVLIAPPSARSRIGALATRVREAVRLFGAAPVLAHFPPFERAPDFQACCVLRTAAIVRSTRRMARVIGARCPSAGLKTFQHGLYLTIAAGAAASADDVKTAAADVATGLAAQSLPARHAGSFGFDFVAIEGGASPDGGRSLRICGGDIPADLSEEIGRRIAAWRRGSGSRVDGG